MNQSLDVRTAGRTPSRERRPQNRQQQNRQQQKRQQQTPQQKRSVVPSQVEPRLAQRRQAVQRAGDRRTRRRLVMVLVAVFLLGAALGGAFSPIFDVDRLEVEGNTKRSDADLTRLSGVTKGQAMITLDPDEIASALEADPWIAHASVLRSLPGTVSLRVLEERPLLVVSSPRDSALVSATGRVLDHAPDNDGLQLGTGGQLLLRAELTGRSESMVVGGRVDELLDGLVRLAKRIPAPLLAQIESVAVEPSGQLSLVLNDAISVVFGPAEDTAAKLAALQAVLGQVQLDCVETIDVRNPVKATVARGPGCPGISPDTESSNGSTGSGSKADDGD